MDKRIITGIIIVGVLVVAIILSGINANFILNQTQKEKTITIGAILPLSGKNATYGEEIKNAIELALAEENQINKTKVTVLFEDDAANPQTGVSAAQKLIESNNVPVILGPWASSVVLAIAPIAEEKKTIVLAEALAPGITTAGDYIFRIQPQAKYYAQKNAQYLFGKRVNTAAILYVNNEFGVALKDEFTKEYTKLGGKVLESETYNQNENDFRTQLQKIKETKPSSVFIAGYQETTDIIKQLHELGIEAQIVAGPTFESQATLDKLSALAEGIVYASHFDNSNENTKMQEFLEKYWAKYGKESGPYAPLMYDGTKIISKILQDCGTDSDCIKEKLYQTNYDGVVGRITFDTNGDTITNTVMKTVKKGKFAVVK